MLGDRIILMTARPGKIKSTYEVNLPRPRKLELRTTPEYNQLAQVLWEDLVEEVNKVMKNDEVAGNV
jgi:NitT/TauT family transport system ATP-binding protein